MDFRNAYKKEMDAMKRNELLDEQILNQISENEKVISFRKWKAVAAVVVLFFVAAVGLNMDKISTYAESLYGAYQFSMGGDSIFLDDIEPIDFDYESLQEHTQIIELGEMSFNGRDYDVQWGPGIGWVYETYAELTAETGMEIPGDEHIEYGMISLHLFDSKDVAHVSSHFLWEGEEFYFNGYCVTELYDGTGKLGYGVEEVPFYVYEYQEGERAYFVKNEEFDTVAVYFSEGGFVFQLMLGETENAVEKGKAIIDCMAQ